MNRRDALRLSFFSPFVCSYVAAGCAMHENERPNILLIISDDQGYHDLGCYGNEWIRTPRLDQLAGEGVRFTNFYTASPLCSPTRASILTGRYPYRSGVFDVVRPTWKGIESSEVLLPEVLREAGYRTALLGKWHLGEYPENQPLHNGFDYHFGFLTGGMSDYYKHVQLYRQGIPVEAEGHMTDVITDETVGYLKSAGGQPFFLMVAYTAPHTPLQSLERYREMYGARDDDARSYLGLITHLDDSIGRIMEALKSEGLDENTCVIFASDNGSQSRTTDSNFPFAGYKNSLHEGGIHVPMIVRWPGRIPAGEVFDDTTVSMDLFATILDIAHVPVPEHLTLDGSSFLPGLQGGEWRGHDLLAWHHRRQKGLLRGKWKLLIDEGRATTALYDLDRDPGERNDLSVRNPELVRELTDLWDKWKESVPVESGFQRGPYSRPN